MAKEKTYKVGNKTWTQAELDELGIDKTGKTTEAGRRQNMNRMDKTSLQYDRESSDRSKTDDFDAKGNLTQYAKTRNRVDQYEEEKKKKKKSKTILDAPRGTLLD